MDCMFIGNVFRLFCVSMIPTVMRFFFRIAGRILRCHVVGTITLTQRTLRWPSIHRNKLVAFCPMVPSLVAIRRQFLPFDGTFRALVWRPLRRLLYEPTNHFPHRSFPIGRVGCQKRMRFLSTDPRFNSVYRPFLAKDFHFRLSLGSVFYDRSRVSPMEPMFLRTREELRTRLLRRFSRHFTARLGASFLGLAVSPPMPVASPIFVRSKNCRLFRVDVLILDLLR